MANFNTHLTVGFLTSTVLAVIGFKAGLLNSEQLIICTLIGTVGGLLPDIDSDNSMPFRMGVVLVSLILAFASVIYWRHSLPLLQMILIWIIGFVVMRYVLFKLFSRLTVHRGVIHSVPYMAMVALALVHVNYYFLKISEVNSWLYGLFLFIGSMVHLTLDEMYSVNLVNMKVKRSFGTALKFFNVKKAWYFMTIYFFIVILSVTAPPFSQFWHQLTNPITWSTLQTSMI